MMLIDRIDTRDEVQWTGRMDRTGNMPCKGPGRRTCPTPRFGAGSGDSRQHGSSALLLVLPGHSPYNSAMGRKLIVDCSPGIDDAIALSLVLFDPSLEVVAVTATEGAVAARQASCNVQGLIELLDPPRLPRLGAATPQEVDFPTYLSVVLGSDGLANLGLGAARLHHEHLSEKILYDEIATASDAPNVLTLGPLTNLWKVFQRDVGTARRIGQLVMAGGSLSGVGDVTPVAEFNMYCDPESARGVFRTPCNKVLVTLDVARRVTIHLDILDCLPSDGPPPVRVLRKLVTHYFRAFHQHFGWEHIILPRTVAAVFLIHPQLFETRAMAGDVETRGELTRGFTVFDRRHPVGAKPNMDVVIDVTSATDVRQVIYQALLRLAQRTL